MARLDGSLALLYVNRAGREAFGAAPWPWWPPLRTAAARVFETRRPQPWQFEALVEGEPRLHAGHIVPELEGASFDTVVAIAVASAAPPFDAVAVAHDLRTPLNAIQSWAHVLEGLLGDADPAVRRAIAGVLLGVSDQAAMIDALVRTHPPGREAKGR